MRFEFKADISRTVEETIDITVEADGYEEAEGLAYEILTNYPQSDKVAVTYRAMNRYYHAPDVIDLTCLRKPIDTEPKGSHDAA